MVSRTAHAKKSNPSPKSKVEIDHSSTVPNESTEKKSSVQIPMTSIEAVDGSGAGAGLADGSNWSWTEVAAFIECGVDLSKLHKAHIVDPKFALDERIARHTGHLDNQ